MPKVLISVSERVTYSREVEMSEAEWKHWSESTYQRGRLHHEAVEELRSKYIRSAQDWQDADQLQLEGLSVVGAT